MRFVNIVLLVASAMVIVACSPVSVYRSPAAAADAAARRGPEPKPIYPAALLNSGVGGKVVAHVYVEPSGHVADVKIIESPHELISAEVVATLKKWRFRPEPVGFIGEYTFDFRP
jgi:TonB family protein